MELTFARPEPIDQIPEAERTTKVKQNKDLASIGYDKFFVRTLFPLPVLDRGEPYNLGVWAEVSEETFFRIRDLWDEPEQDKEPAFQATLQNRIPNLPETCGLPVMLHLTRPMTRPRLPFHHLTIRSMRSSVRALLRTPPISTHKVMVRRSNNSFKPKPPRGSA